MSLLTELLEQENKKNKLFHDIVMAASVLQDNINKSKTAETKEEREKALEDALVDAKFIEELALSVNNGVYDK